MSLCCFGRYSWCRAAKLEAGKILSREISLTLSKSIASSMGSIRTEIAKQLELYSEQELSSLKGPLLRKISMFRSMFWLKTVLTIYSAIAFPSAHISLHPNNSLFFLALNHRIPPCQQTNLSSIIFLKNYMLFMRIVIHPSYQ